MVSWAFVGIPLRRELDEVSLRFHFWSRVDILFEFKIFLPIWDLAIQEVEATPDQWVAEEAKAHSSVSGLHNNRGGGEQSYRNYWDENACQPETSSLLGKWRRW